MLTAQVARARTRMPTEGVRTGLLLLLLTVLTACSPNAVKPEVCSQLMYVAGTSDYPYVEGLYVLHSVPVPLTLQGAPPGTPAYRHVCRGVYMYYEPTTAAWWIGPELGATAGYALSRTTAGPPSGMVWKYWCEREEAWLYDAGAKLMCLDISCKSFTMTSLPPLPSQLSGEFQLTEVLFSERPVYKNTASSLFVYYSTARGSCHSWVVGEKVGDAHSYMYMRSASRDPLRVVGNWTVTEGNAKPSLQVTLICLEYYRYRRRDTVMPKTTDTTTAALTSGHDNPTTQFEASSGQHTTNTPTGNHSTNTPSEQYTTSIPSGQHIFNTPSGTHATSISIEHYNTSTPREQYNTSVPSEQYNTNTPGEQYNTNTPSEQYNSNTISEQYNTDIPSEQYNTNIPSEQYNTNTPSKQYNTNTPSEQYNSNTTSEQYNTNIPSEQYNTNIPSEQHNTNTPSEQFNANTPTEQYNSNTNSEQYNADIPSEQYNTTTPREQSNTDTPSEQYTINTPTAQHIRTETPSGQHNTTNTPSFHGSKTHNEQNTTNTPRQQQSTTSLPTEQQTGVDINNWKLTGISTDSGLQTSNNASSWQGPSPSPASAQETNTTSITLEQTSTNGTIGQQSNTSTAGTNTVIRQNTSTTETAKPGGPQSQGQCGRVVTERVAASFIVSAHNSPFPGRWPWMVAILRRDNVTKCGAVLVASRYLVTAAHCVDGPAQVIATYRVLLGANNRDVTERGQVWRAIRRVVLHANFTFIARPFRIQNDVGVVELDRAVAFTEYVQPVCLAHGSHVTLPLPAVRSTFTACYITGFGFHSVDASGRVSSAGGTLQEQAVRLEATPACARRYFPAYRWLGTSSTVCARPAHGAKLCQGDSGSPLMCREGARWTLVGVASWSIQACISGNIPSIYTDLTLHADWIRQQINNQSTSS